MPQFLGFGMGRMEALKRVEARKDDRINFVTTHSEYLPNVNKHRNYLQENGLESYVECHGLIQWT